MSMVFSHMSDIPERTELIEQGMSIEHFFAEQSFPECADFEDDLVFGTTEIPEAFSFSEIDHGSESLWLLSEAGINLDGFQRSELFPTALNAPISLSEFDNYLEIGRINFDKTEHSSLDELAEALAQQDKVFCYVPKSGLYYPSFSSRLHNADCMVRVCGIDLRPEKNPSVLTYVFEDGWRRCEISAFLTAWSKSNNLCYFVH